LATLKIAALRFRVGNNAVFRVLQRFLELAGPLSVLTYTVAAPVRLHKLPCMRESMPRAHQDANKLDLAELARKPAQRRPGSAPGAVHVRQEKTR